MKHFIGVIALVSICSTSLYGQSDSLVDLMFTEGRKILEHPEYSERQKANQNFKQCLEAYVSSETGFDDPLKDVTNMLRLELGDEARIYTWQMPDSLFQYKRFGLFVSRIDDEPVLTSLEEVPDVINMQFKVLKPKDWYGAIYYEAIPERKKKPRFYTVLGFAPGSDLNEKYIDVISIDKRGRPVFGAKVFHVDEFMDKTLQQAPMRLILKYNAEYAASVKWLDDESLIVMDHLSPPDAKLKGVYRMYGPSMSYNALRWDKKWWYLETEVEFNSKQNIEIRPPNKTLDLPPAPSRDRK